MEKDVKEFIDLLLTPVPPEDAEVFVQLCRQELTETLEGDRDRAAEKTDTASDEVFDRVFAMAMTLDGSQRRRLITSLVNYEVLVRRYATNGASAESPGLSESNVGNCCALTLRLKALR